MKQHTTLCGLLLLLVASTAVAQSDDEMPRFRTVPWTIFAGAGTDFDSYSLSLGVRRGPWGLGVGYRRNTETKLPSYSTSAAPVGATETSFGASTLGLDLYTATAIADFLTGYATIGGYADINTVLSKDEATGAWYLSENSPDWTNARVAYGAGLEIAPLDWLVAGLGYHSVRGFNLHLGYSW